MADEVSIFAMGTIEIVECGDEMLVRVPLLIDGEEIGEIMLASEDDPL